MRDEFFTGIGITKRIGIGKAFCLSVKVTQVRREKVADISMEMSRYSDARLRFREETEKIADELKGRAGNSEVDLIIRGQLALADDAQFDEDITALIEERYCAEWAVENVCAKYAHIFETMDNEVLQQRAADFLDIKDRFIRILNDDEICYYNQCLEDIDLQDLVLVAKELQPSIMATLDASKLAGIVAEGGGETSHTAILARALGIPTILGVKGITERLVDDDVLIVNGVNGEVIVNPDSKTMQIYMNKKDELDADAESLSVYRERIPYTHDGERIGVFANAASAEEIFKADEYNSDGIGLFRTEFVFMNSDRLPSMEEQFDIYRKVVMASKGKEIIFRTLDIGGDKEVEYLGLEKEYNPFLGLRGIRLCLDRYNIFQEQIEAMLRATASGEGNVRIMFPMVSTIEEIKSAKSIIEAVKDRLREQGVDYDEHVKIGIMIETPAAVMMADVYAKEVDFFSIGTNDLTQYTMAVDRENKNVAYLYDVMSPAVIRAVKHIINAANASGIEVSMCGEAASVPELIPLWLGLGLRKFSVSASLLLETKKNIAKWDIETAERIADDIMNMTSVEEIREYVNRL